MGARGLGSVSPPSAVSEGMGEGSFEAEVDADSEALYSRSTSTFTKYGCNCEVTGAFTKYGSNHEVRVQSRSTDAFLRSTGAIATYGCIYEVREHWRSTVPVTKYGSGHEVRLHWRSTTFAYFANVLVLHEFTRTSRMHAYFAKCTGSVRISVCEAVLIFAVRPLRSF